jgi:hypothetical protein
MAAQLHFPENTFALHLLLERFQRLVDVVVTDENLHLVAFSYPAVRPGLPGAREKTAGISRRRRRAYIIGAPPTPSGF